MDALTFSLKPRDSFICTSTLNRELKHLATLQEAISQCVATDGLPKWRSHTKQQHLFSDVPHHLRSCGLETATQAFAKASEILLHFPQMIRCQRRKPFRSLHLCEIPGDFVCALSRFLAIYHSNIEWEWSANSLNPHHEFNEPQDMLLQDRLVNAYNNWWFGDDGSGDIIKYCECVVDGGNYDLVTADGSCYVQDDPEHQESVVFDLLKAEVLNAIKNLRKGGSFVMKTYSYRSQKTVHLICSLMSVFAEVHAMKPLCSKPGNGERYLCCINYSGLPMSQDFLDNDYRAVVSDCELFMTQQQINAISSNVKEFKNINVNRNSLRQKRSEIAQHFGKLICVDEMVANINKFPVISLNDRQSAVWEGVTLQPNLVERLREISAETVKHWVEQELSHSYILQTQDIPVEFENGDDNWDYSSEDRIVSHQKCSDANSIRHTLFMCPLKFKALQLLKKDSVLDVLGSDIEVYFEEEKSILNSKKDWISFLYNIVNPGIKNQLPNCIRFVSCHDVFVLSRFAASCLGILSAMYNNTRILHSGNGLMIFYNPVSDRKRLVSLSILLKSIKLRTNSTMFDTVSFCPLYKMHNMYQMISSFNSLRFSNVATKLLYSS